jgi:prepilin-type processing-associated H-X9-DG protein
MTEYTGDFDGYIVPPGSPRLSDGTATSNLTFASDCLTAFGRDYLGMDTANMGAKYKGILYCPSRNYPAFVKNDGSVTADCPRHYTLTYYHCSDWYTALIPLKFIPANFPRPSTTLWVVDSGDGGSPFNTSNILSRFGNVHSGMGNIVYMDGHNDRKKPTDVTSQEVNPKL